MKGVRSRAIVLYHAALALLIGLMPLLGTGLIAPDRALAGSVSYEAQTWDTEQGGGSWVKAVGPIMHIPQPHAALPGRQRAAGDGF